MKTVFYLVAGFGAGTFVSYLISGSGIVGWVALLSAVVILILGFKVFKSR